MRFVTALAVVSADNEAMLLVAPERAW